MPASDEVTIDPLVPSTLTADELDRHASEFASAIPSRMYSIAQIQGYLLTKKHDPLAAVQDVKNWLVAQEMERRALSESKRRWRAELARWRRGSEDGCVDAWERVIGGME